MFSQMERFEVSLGVQLGHKLYVLSDNLANSLQLEKLSAVSRKRNANLTKKTIESVENYGDFNMFYQTVLR